VRRREFIGLIGGTAVVWPLAGRAQQQAMPVVGFVDWGPRNELGITSFLQGLNEIGYVESLKRYRRISVGRRPLR
jgi:putative ABC transport system substrate-binding protein